MTAADKQSMTAFLTPQPPSRLRSRQFQHIIAKMQKGGRFARDVAEIFRTQMLDKRERRLFDQLVEEGWPASELTWMLLETQWRTGH